MTQISQDILQLVRYAIAGGEEPTDIGARLSEMTQPEWYAFIEAVKRNGCAAIVYDALQTLQVQMPRIVKMRWIYLTTEIEQHYAQQLKAFARLADFYAANGLKMMLLKGLGASQWYPVPNHRECGDIDVWLFGEQERADRLIHEQRGTTIEYNHHVHTVFQMGGISIENHYNFIPPFVCPSARRVEHALHVEAAKGSVACIIANRNTLIPSPDFNALFLCYHSGSHFSSSEIGLRHLLDWCLFLRTYGRNVDWPHVRTVATEAGFIQFMDAMNCLAVEEIGIDPTLVPPYQCTADLRDRIMQDILSASSTRDQELPRNFFEQWHLRLRRRLRNRWKQPLVYPEGECTLLYHAVLTHVLPVSYWRHKKIV